MRKPLVYILIAVLALPALGLVAIRQLSRSPGGIAYLPASIQHWPSVYVDIALTAIRTAGMPTGPVDWEAVSARARELAKGASTPAETYTAIQYALEQLGGGRGIFMSPPPPGGPEAPSAFGMQVLHPERIVAAVYPRSPADAAGIASGDEIVLVNGAAPVVSSDPRARGQFIDLPKPTVVLQVRKPGETVGRDITLTAGPFLPRPARTARISDRYAYIDLPGTGEDPQFAMRLRSAIAELDQPGLCGWVVDVRRNNGGGLWPTLQSVRALLGDAPLGAFVAGDDQRRAWAFPESGPGAFPPVAPLSTPEPRVAVLTSRLTANAGEMVVIAFRGRPHTRVMGEPTWGVAGGRALYRMPDGAALDLTAALPIDRTGKVYEGAVVPDDTFPIDWARIDTLQDPGILRAVEWLGQGCGKS